MKITKKGQIAAGQDGAIWGNLLFRLEATGLCHVYDLSGDGIPKVDQFLLDRVEILRPHSNSVMFGSEFYSPEDEFPLLYSNIYNNYARQPDRLEGVCCVYRLRRLAGRFETRLVQVIRVGFAQDLRLWRSGQDARPYGNFTIDREKGIYYGFTMRDEADSTRYFAFRVPGVRDGVVDSAWGVPVVTLEEKDILSQFDCPYHRFVQGACAHGGKIYSLEGFTDDAKNPPALRIIDPARGVQEALLYFGSCGTQVEPELIDFQHGQCWYADCCGALYTIDFQEDA